MKQKQTIYEWLTTNFLVNIRNEENFSLKRSFSLNYAKILVFFSLAFIVSAFSTYYAVHIIQYYTSDEIKKEREYDHKLLKLAMAVDSLQIEIAQRDSFIVNVKKTINGEIPNNELDPSMKRSVATLKHSHPEKEEYKLSEAESELRRGFEKTEIKEDVIKKKSLPHILPSNHGIYEIFFFPPLSGYIINQYDRKEMHYGIDILSKENEPIKCVADGAVIYSGWSYDTGYMLVIQHDEGLISVYKHTSSLLKKVGENAKSGEVVAIIGNSGEITTGPHLHFELWYEGNPLNPLDYIAF